MIANLITVQPHPENESGWAIYEGEDLMKLLNVNFFLDHDHALRVAHARRHVLHMQAVNELLINLKT